MSRHGWQGVRHNEQSSENAGFQLVVQNAGSLYNIRIEY
jgi:hypothetical protein